MASTMPPVPPTSAVDAAARPVAAGGWRRALLGTAVGLLVGTAVGLALPRRPGG